MKTVWSELAKSQLQEIFSYYKETVNAKIAGSIKAKILEKTKSLTQFPEIGALEGNPLVATLNYRYLISGNYKIVDKIFPDENNILIAAIFDTRQNPNDLKVQH